MSKNILRQQIKSQYALRFVRTGEAKIGMTIGQWLGRPFRPLATPARKHHITDRAVRKAAMRAFIPGNPFVQGLTPHLHSAQRL